VFAAVIYPGFQPFHGIGLSDSFRRTGRFTGPTSRLMTWVVWPRWHGSTTGALCGDTQRVVKSPNAANAVLERNLATRAMLKW